MTPYILRRRATPTPRHFSQLFINARLSLEKYMHVAWSLEGNTFFTNLCTT